MTTNPSKPVRRGLVIQGGGAKGAGVGIISTLSPGKERDELKRIIIAVLYILIAVVDFFFKAPRGPVTDQGGTGVFPPVPHVRCRRVAPHRATTLASPSGIVGISPTLKSPPFRGGLSKSVVRNFTASPVPAAALG
jgi:hypothetical protein